MSFIARGVREGRADCVAVRVLYRCERKLQPVMGLLIGSIQPNYCLYS